MPKRTREQKIRSQNRRLSELSKIAPITHEQASEGGISYKFSPTAGQPQNLQTVAKTERVLSQATEDAIYVKKDIMRILLVMTILLMIEFTAYYLIEIQQIHFSLLK